ncbi:hypothetical protein cypCar_00040614 [Cyprinus carpio]|nr:hypothetical protein cypCar_00040614 [Cyprinus carpio]
MAYIFQDTGAIKPVSFLQALNSLTVLTTASTLTTSATSPPTLLGKVYINIRLVFNTLGQIPSETIILQLAKSLIGPRYRTKDVSTPTQDASLMNVTYTRINDTSYALTFGFEISNISIAEKIELRNETYTSIKSTINELLIEILKDPSASQFDLHHVEFKDNSTVILASVQYVFSESDLNTNSTFVQKIFKANEVLTTASTLTTTSPPNLLGKVIIYIRLVFRTRGTIPSQSNVIHVANTLLNGMKLRTKRALTTKDLTELVSFVNVTYTKKLEFRNETYKVIQNYINSFVSTILNKTTTTDFNFNQIIFKGNSTVIEASVEYVFTDTDIGSFGLVTTLLGLTTTAAPTTFYPTILHTTISNNSTNAAWIVAIIVPCAIVIGLVPCWILLCVMFAVWLLCSNQKTLAQKTVIQCAVHHSKQSLLEIFKNKL